MVNKSANRVAMILLAAVVGLPGSYALAQARLDNGNVLDASNRIGSGGRNEPQPGDAIPNTGATGNQIITGNTTGNKQFRDRVGYSDPREFQGPVAGTASEKLNRESAPVDYRARTTGSNNTVPYYSSNRTASPNTLPDFQAQGYGGGYVPKGPQYVQPNDTRLGIVGRFATPLPRPGELAIPGPVDPSNNNSSTITASPLYGIRQSRAGDADDELFLARYSNLRPESGLDRLRMSDEEVKKAREEIAKANDKTIGEAKGDKPEGLTGPGTTSLPGSTTPGSTKPNPAIENPPLTGATSSNLGSTTKFMLPVPAEDQTPELKNLMKLAEQYKADRKVDDVTLNRLYQREFLIRKEILDKKAREAAAKSAGPVIPIPPAKGTDRFGSEDLGKKARDQAIARGMAVSPGTGTLNTTPDGQAIPKPVPIVISTLTKNVPEGKLHDLLAKAEDLTRTGKYASALDQYDAAEQIAPNNPMIVLGRAHTELAASYFGKAESDLRLAFMSNHALLLGRYDLKSFLGVARLESLVKDLREVMNTEKQQSRAPLLLAYIAYSTGNDRLAGEYLEQAETRGGADVLITLFRANWSIPGAPSAPETK